MTFQKGNKLWNNAKSKASRFQKGDTIRKGCKQPEDAVIKQKEFMKSYWKTHEHPRGMLGKPSWNKGKKSITPAWNKGLTPRTEEYKTPMRRIKGKMFKASVVNWCGQRENLPFVPNGFVIHHLDCNPKNNEPSNLILLKGEDHSKLHHQLSKLILGHS